MRGNLSLEKITGRKDATEKGKWGDSEYNQLQA